MNKIRFTIDDPGVAFRVGEVFKSGNQSGRYQVTRALGINKAGKPEYEAVRIDVNRKQLRARMAQERKKK